MSDSIKLVSLYGIGDCVRVFGQAGRVQMITFSINKVLYDVDLDEGGEPLQRIDSSFVFAPPRPVYTQ